MVKSVGWWGWHADPLLRYGGADYKSNKMNDVSVHAFFRDLCYTRKTIKKGVTVPPGTFCGLSDWSHIAIACGNNLVIEATRYGTHNVRLARIKGLETLDRFSKLPEREFDFYAFCKYVSFDDVYLIRDKSGFETITPCDFLVGLEEPPKWFAPVTLETIKIQK